MTLMVQDLTNPMLAQIPHVLLAAHAGTIMGVETNAMQFYPDASVVEAGVHPGLYVRRNGRINLETIQGPGFGYQMRAHEIGVVRGRQLMFDFSIDRGTLGIAGTAFSQGGVVRFAFDRCVHDSDGLAWEQRCRCDCEARGFGILAADG